MTYKEFVKIIKEKRLKLGYTQKYVALNMAISASKYCKIENASQEPNFTQLVRIAQILNLNMNEIFEIDLEKKATRFYD